jgi:hypothetical protein
MEIYKKIILFIAFFIFIYVIFDLYQRKQRLALYLFNVKENFDLPNPSSQSSEDIELNRMIYTDQQKITSMSPEDMNMPLSQYVVKASYNSACTGNYVNTKAIEYLISRGCRFVDFEVFDISGIPHVAFSKDPTFKSIDSKNKILLNDALTTVVTCAFSSKSPNLKDPLFINLRIKSNNNNIYKLVAKSVDATLKPKLYNGKINDNTNVSDMAGKIVLLVDKTIRYDYKDYTGCGPKDTNCYDLSKYINMESGSDYLRLNQYSTMLDQKKNRPRILDDNEHTDKKYINLVIPDFNMKNTANPSIGAFVKEYGCQIVAYKFYNKDAQLEEYETLFNDNRYGTLKLADTIIYLTKEDEELNA